MTCGITVAPMIPVASRMLSVPAKPGVNRCLTTSPPSAFELKISNAKATTTTPTIPTMTASRRRKPRCWSAEDGERPGAGEQPRWKQWNPEEQVEAEGRTDHLGHVTRCRHDLGLNP